MIAFHIFSFSLTSFPILYDLGVTLQFQRAFKIGSMLFYSFFLGVQWYKRRFFFMFDNDISKFSFLVYLGKLDPTASSSTWEK